LAAVSAYRQCVPHYPLAVQDIDGPIYHSFSIGRIYYILTDLRSERDPKKQDDTPEKTMLGLKQKKWLKDELLRGSLYYSLVVWASSVPWIGEPDEHSDTWAGYNHERLELAEFIEKNNINNLLMLSGDAHMLAIDDGSNNTYGPSGNPLFPIMHAAAFDRSGRIKGGPYSHGAVKGGGHFGLMSIEDDGGNTINVILSGRNYLDEEIMGINLEVDVNNKTLSVK
jgi:alkaline phosphatase D